MHSTDNTHSIALCLSIFLSLDHIVQVMLYHCNRFYCSNINIYNWKTIVFDCGIYTMIVAIAISFVECTRSLTLTHKHNASLAFFDPIDRIRSSKLQSQRTYRFLCISFGKNTIICIFSRRISTSYYAYYTHSSLNITIVSVIVHWKWCLSNNKTTFVLFPQEFVCVQMNILLQFEQFRDICCVMNFQVSFSLKNWFKTNFPSDLFVVAPNFISNAFMNIIWINQKVSLVLAKIREMKYSISIIYRMQLLAVVRKHSNNTNVQKIHRCIYSFSVMQSIYRQTFCFASTTKSYTMSEFAKTERILQYSIQLHLQCCIYWISLNIEIANAIPFSI